jgi:hypothetical protein
VRLGSSKKVKIIVDFIPGDCDKPELRSRNALNNLKNKPRQTPERNPLRKPSEHLSAVALGPPKLYAKAEPNRKK